MPTEALMSIGEYLGRSYRPDRDSMQEKVRDYLDMGVPYVWIMDPHTRKAWRCEGNDLHEVTELRTEDPEIVVPIAALFED